MRHSDLWRGIDTLAERRGLSPSALARMAGLDATAFNPSKRQNRDGRPRWPSTESLSRVLDVVGVSFEEFSNMVAGGTGKAAAPLIGFAQAGSDGFFDDSGFPIGSGWEEVAFPGLDTQDGLYALEIAGDSMEPAYRAGDRVVVSPTAPIRRGDRVIARTVSGEVMAKILEHRTATSIELRSLNPAHPTRKFKPQEIAWISRIIWVSQ